MRDRLDDVAGPDGDRAEVVLVTFSSAEEVDSYRQRRDLPFTILLDADRTVYGAFGLGRGSFLSVWGWRTIRRYWQILRPSGAGSYHDLHRTTEDTRQLGGDMVIAPDGRLAWGHWSSGPADRPSVDEIATAVTRAVEEVRT